MRNNENGRKIHRAGEHGYPQIDDVSHGALLSQRNADKRDLLGAWALLAAIVCVVAAFLTSGCVPGIKRFSEQLLWPEKQAASGNQGPGNYTSRPGYPPQGYQTASRARSNLGPVLDESGAEFDRAATAGKSRPSWEDQKVKIAALDLAKSKPSVAKIKICYDARHDEWWVILYDRLGGEIDLKQFVWNRETDTLDPFLVMKRIPEGKLEEHAVREEKDKACEAFDPSQAARFR